MHQSRFERMIYWAGSPDWDQHDIWGTTMNMFFDVASVLDMTDIEGDVTPKPFKRWDYNRSPYVTIPAVETVAARAEDFSEGEYTGDYTYGQVALASAYVNGDITQDDLIYAGDVLSRYTDMLRRAGKDY